MRRANSRSRAFVNTGLANAPKRSKNNLCDRCHHFRSDHPRSQECNLCDCTGMMFNIPTQAKGRRSVITEEMMDKAESLLKDGMSYTDVAQMVGCSHGTLRRRLPGHGLKTVSEAYGRPWENAKAVIGRPKDLRGGRPR